MSDIPRKSPEVAPEVGPEVPGSRWLTMPAAAELLGMSERAARDWVRRQNVPIHGSRPMRVSEQVVLAQMAAEERAPRKPPVVAPEVFGSCPEVPGSTEPIEAAYTAATPVQVERAIEATATRYMTDFAMLYDRISAEVGQVYEGQLAAKDQAIAFQQETIAELRRRAEAAERERDELRAQSAPAPPSEAPTILVTTEAPEPQRPAQGFWQRLRRVFGGE